MVRRRTAIRVLTLIYLLCTCAILITVIVWHGGAASLIQLAWCGKLVDVPRIPVYAVDASDGMRLIERDLAVANARHFVVSGREELRFLLTPPVPLGHDDKVIVALAEDPRSIREVLALSRHERRRYVDAMKLRADMFDNADRFLISLNGTVIAWGWWAYRRPGACVRVVTTGGTVQELFVSGASVPEDLSALAHALEHAHSGNVLP